MSAVLGLATHVLSLQQCPRPEATHAHFPRSWSGWAGPGPPVHVPMIRYSALERTGQGRRHPWKQKGLSLLPPRLTLLY